MSPETSEWRTMAIAIDTALIGTGVVMVQPYLTSAAIELPAQVSVFAFAVAIPLLSALLLLAHHETELRRMSRPLVVGFARGSARVAGFVGVTTGFWNISWLAGVAIIVSGALAVAVYSAGYGWLDRVVAQRRDT